MATARLRFSTDDRRESKWGILWVVLATALTLLIEQMPFFEDQFGWSAAVSALLVALAVPLRRYLMDTRPEATVDSDGREHTISKA